MVKFGILHLGFCESVMAEGICSNISIYSSSLWHGWYILPVGYLFVNMEKFLVNGIGPCLWQYKIFIWIQWCHFSMSLGIRLMLLALPLLLLIPNIIFACRVPLFLNSHTIRASWYAYMHVFVCSVYQILYTLIWASMLQCGKSTTNFV